MLLISIIISPRLMSNAPRPVFAYLLFTMALSLTLKIDQSPIVMGLIIIDIAALAMLVHRGIGFKRSKRREIIISILIVIVGCPVLAISLPIEYSLMWAFKFALYTSYLLFGVILRMKITHKIIQVSIR